MEVRSFAVRRRELRERERVARFTDKKLNRGSCGDWGALRLSRTLCGTGEGECPRGGKGDGEFALPRGGRAVVLVRVIYERVVLRVIYYANASGAEPAI